MQSNELENIIRMGCITKEFNILNMKVSMRSLTASEISVILKEISGYDDIAKSVMTQIKTLAHSIISINDKKIEYNQENDDDTPTQPKRIVQNEKIIEKWQKAVVDLFYDKYAELREEQQSFLSKSQTSLSKPGAEKSGK